MLRVVFLVSRWTKAATDQCHWLKNVQCDRWEHSGEVTENGTPSVKVFRLNCSVTSRGRQHSWKTEPVNYDLVVDVRNYVRAFHLAERSTAGYSWVRPESSCFCWGQAHAFLPVVSVSCSDGDLEGLSFKHSRGKRIICLTEVLGVTKFSFYSQAHSNR